MTAPVVGAKVRVTLEGDVTEVNGQTFTVKDYDIHVNDVDVVVLSLPYPKWKVGTLVKVSGMMPFFFTREGWQGVGNLSPERREEIVEKAWNNGSLTVLYEGGT